MKSLLKLIAFGGLCLTVIPSFLVFNELITIDLHKNLMFVGMLLWFVSIPFLLKKTKAKV